MIEYSLKSRADDICHPNTKTHFEEVLESYWNGNYRAALVVLWVVLLFDLLNKLEHLRDGYNDDTAGSILDDVTKFQKDHPNSPKWEEKLITSIHQRAHYWTSADKTRIEKIRDLRNLAAHPTFEDGTMLYQPNAEAVRAAIVDALDIVLCKPTLLHRGVFDDLTDELERLRGQFADNSRLRRFLENKYFEKLTPHAESKVFRALWKFVFRSTGTRESQNRAINAKALRFLYQRNPRKRIEQIRSDKEFFDDVEATGDPVEYLTLFVLDAPEVFDLLTAGKESVRNYLDGNPELKAANWLEAESVESHIEMIRKKLESDRAYVYRNQSEHAEKNGEMHIHPIALKVMVDKAKTINLTEMAIEIATLAYGMALDFNTADAVFANAISPVLEKMDAEQLKNLLGAIESNDQTYNRHKATEDHGVVRERCDEVLSDSFDFTDYPKFENSY